MIVEAMDCFFHVLKLNTSTTLFLIIKQLGLFRFLLNFNFEN